MIEMFEGGGKNQVQQFFDVRFTSAFSACEAGRLRAGGNSLIRAGNCRLTVGFPPCGRATPAPHTDDEVDEPGNALKGRKFGNSGISLRELNGVSRFAYLKMAIFD